MYVFYVILANCPVIQENKKLNFKLMLPDHNPTSVPANWWYSQSASIMKSSKLVPACSYQLYLVHSMLSPWPLRPYQLFQQWHGAARATRATPSPPAWCPSESPSFPPAVLPPPEGLDFHRTRCGKIDEDFVAILASCFKTQTPYVYPCFLAS